MKKTSNRIKNKKGFSLAECIVALLLFSVITASVLSVFTASRNQIKKQNDQYKIEMMASNLLAAYEGSNTSGSFGNRLKGLGLELSTSDAFNTTIGTEGTGQYSFDTQNVPIAVPFSKIVVKEGSATFRNENDSSDMVSFVGTYPDNKLQSQANWNVAELYDEKELKQLKSMTLTGTARPTLSFKPNSFYKYTLEIGESFTKLTYGDFSKELESSSFDKYLLKKGYYLKCIDGDSPNLFNATDSGYYYFQVYSVFTKQPVKLDGKNLYYYVYYSKPYYTCNSQLSNVADNDNRTNSYYFDLTGCTFKYLLATSIQKNPDAFSNLTDDNGKSFDEGNWYFYPWLAFRQVKSFSPECSDYQVKMVYHEYTAKSGVASNIYYALNTAKNTEMLLFNSDGSLIFPYKNDSADPLRNLVSNCGFGIDGKRNTLAIYEGTTYDKWFKRGAVPLWNVTKVRFTDGGGSAVSKIVFYGVPEGSSTENEYITFLYLPDKYSDFTNDRNSILDFGSVDSKWYNYEKNFTAKSLKNISDDSGLAPYKQMDVIKAKNLGASTTEETVSYYTVSEPENIGTRTRPKYRHTYTYCTYKVTASKSVQLTNYKEDAHTLKIVRSGDTVTCTEVISDSATLKTVYTYTAITQTAKDKTVTVDTGSSKNPPSTPPAEIKGRTQEVGTHEERYLVVFTKTVPDWDYTDSNTALQHTKDSFSASSDEVLHGLVSGSTYSVVPEDLAESWNLTAEPAEAPLHTVAELSSLVKHTDVYEVQVGGNTVFTAHTDDFVISAGGVSAGGTDCVYDVIGGEAADIKAETYYITWTSGDITLISLVTYSNFTKEFEVDGVMMKKEPKIMIWSIPRSEVPADVKTVTDSRYSKYLYRVYRKG